jgi:hypothetical protein
MHFFGTIRKKAGKSGYSEPTATKVVPDEATAAEWRILFSDNLRLRNRAAGSPPHRLARLKI